MLGAWGKVWLRCATVLTATLLASLAAATHPVGSTSEKVNGIVGDAGYLHAHGRAPGDSVSDTERVRSHLEYAEHLLRQADISHLPPARSAARERVLDHLNDYWRAGRFPQNTYTTRRAPVFIDAQGTLCAVGHLVAETAGLDRARTINAAHRLDRIQDMRLPWLASWARDHGLSLKELSIIQPTYKRGLTPIDRVARSFGRALDAGATPAAVHDCLRAEPWWSPRVAFVHLVMLLRYSHRHFDLDVRGLKIRHENGDDFVATPADARRLRQCLSPVLARQRPPKELLAIPFDMHAVLKSGAVSLLVDRTRRTAQFTLTVEEIRAAFESPARAQQLAACFPAHQKPGFELSLELAKAGFVQQAQAWLHPGLPDIRGCVERVATLVRFRQLEREIQLRLRFEWSKTAIGLVALPAAQHDPFELPQALEPARVLQAFRGLRAPLGHCIRGQVTGRLFQLQITAEPLGSISEAYLVPARPGTPSDLGAEPCMQQALRQVALGRHERPTRAVLLLELLEDRTLVPVGLQPLEGMAVTGLATPPAGLRFEDSPGFEFFVNGVSIGLGPTAVALVAGSHAVVARREGKQLTQIVEVYGGRQRRVQVISGELVVE